MKSHEVLREVFDTANPKQIAEDLGISVSLVYKWAEPPEQGSGAANPLDRVEALLHSTRDPRIVQWMCNRAGGFFVRNPTMAKPGTYAVVPATNKIVQEFADMLGVIASAALDNSITGEEANKIRDRWEDLKAVTENFVTCCEKGNFEAIHSKSA
jgi:hypothetical protein